LGADEKTRTVGFVQDIFPAVFFFNVEIISLEIEFAFFLAENMADLSDNVLSQKFIETIKDEYGRRCFFVADAVDEIEKSDFGH
jgi:hypothetical protein